MRTEIPISTPAKSAQQPADSDLRPYLCAAHYLAAAQIYLQDNVLLRARLRPGHLKPRLLGHWGTCPGINLIYAHLNRLILRHELEILLVTGPGHGAPANLANLYLEGSLQEFHPEFTHGLEGLRKFVKSFSVPGGFPSHLFPGVPGTIHEGGELGYALATSFGAVLDNPDLIAACIVGDGEAETGPTAAAWHCPKFLDPSESGAVLPILHLNGYKISNPTVFGSMTDGELARFFAGAGWNPLLASGDFEAQIAPMMERALMEIRTIQKAARNGLRAEQPRWPILLLRSPKGWTGVKELDGKPVEGSFRAHQVPVPQPHGNPDHLLALESWLRSYHPEELFDEDGFPEPEVLACCPHGEARMGCNPHALGGRLRHPLDLPVLQDVEKTASGFRRGGKTESPMKKTAAYLAEVIRRNPRNFRIFCPDELASNKLDGVFAAPTQRNFQWPAEDGDRSEHVGPAGGRVLEILSEHICQGWLQGYLLTGRHGLFPSYEAFLNIVISMMDQFAKFIKMSMEFPWRLPVPSLTYLETSTLWRQEHNGFSHQNPGFINALLNKKKDVMRVYLPPDANCLLATMGHCLAGTNHINLVIAAKHAMPVWLSPAEAVAHCRAGAGQWMWAGTFRGEDPDVVLAGIGDIVTLEVLAAAALLRREIPALRLRVVNVTDLLVLARSGEHPHGLDDTLFSALFTPDRPVIVNFHGYPSAVEQLLFGRPQSGRFTINGYDEEGTTTTPFDMLVRNRTSRYHLIMQALRLASPRNPSVAAVATEKVRHFEYVLRDFRREIEATGEDPRAITDWQWPAENIS